MHSRQQEVDRSDVHQASRNIDGRCHRTVRLTLWPAPVDGQRAARPRRPLVRLHSSISNVYELATQPRPPFWLEFPDAVTLRPFPVEFSASANQAIGRVDQFNRRSEFLNLCFRKVDGLVWILE